MQFSIGVRVQETELRVVWGSGASEGTIGRSIQQNRDPSTLEGL